MPIPIIPLAIVFGGALVVKNLLSTAHVGDKVQVIPENPKVDFSWKNGLTIKTDIRLQNPTRETVTITKPFVKLLNGTSLIASNTMKQENIKIEKLSEAVIKDLTFNISLIQLGLNAGTIIKNIAQSEKILKGYDLKLEYSLYANGIPVTTVQPIEIG